MPQHRLAIGCTDVADPVRVLAEHRDEVALAVVVRHHHRERKQTARTVATHLEGNHVLHPVACGRGERLRAVCQGRQTMEVVSEVRERAALGRPPRPVALVRR